MKLALLPKKTRGETVVAAMTLRFGDEKSLLNTSTAADLAADMLRRGTAKHTRQQINDEFDRLKARVRISGGSTQAVVAIETVRANLPAVLRLVAEIFRTPAFPATEFDQLKQENLAQIEQQKSEPTFVAGNTYQRHMSDYPKGDVRYVKTADESLADYKAATLDEVKKFYSDFYGASNAELAVVGDFDPKEIAALAGELFGDWKSPKPFTRVPRPYREVAAVNQALPTPDKANAIFLAGMALNLRDDDPDYPALVLGNYMLGGGFLNSAPGDPHPAEGGPLLRRRFPVRREPARQVRDLPDVRDLRAAERRRSSRPPSRRRSRGRAEGRLHGPGSQGGEVRVSPGRAGRPRPGSPLAGKLSGYLFLDRTLAWDAALEKKIAALTPDQIVAAMRRHIDPSKITIVKAGDFEKSGGLGSRPHQMTRAISVSELSAPRFRGGRMKRLVLAAPGGHLFSRRSGPDGRAEVRKPPMAKKIARTETLHGEERRDEYFWLRERKSPEVRSYLDSENAFTDGFMKDTAPLQQKLYDEILGRIKETDLSVPYRKGDYFYYSRTEEGKQYPIYCRKHGSLDAPEEVTIDLNQLAKGERFMARGSYEVSDDGRWLAYTIDNTGFREYTLHVKDLKSGKVGPESIPRVSSVAWAADNSTIFYVVDDDSKRPYRLYRHALGSSSADTLVYEEKDAMFTLGVDRSRSKAFLFLESGSHTASEWRFLPASEPAGAFRLVAAREKEHQYDVDHHGDLFYIRTNQGCRNFRVVTAPVASPARVVEGNRPLPRRRDGLGRRALRRPRRLPRARGWRPAGSRYRSRDGRLPSGRVPRDRLCPVSGSQRRVCDRQVPLQLPVADDAAHRLRLRHGDEGAQAPEAHRGPRRLRPRALQDRADLRDGAGRHEGADLARLSQGARQGREEPHPPERVRILRNRELPDLQLGAGEPARPRLRLRDRPHPRRRRDGQEVARPGKDDVEEEHLHRLHRRRPRRSSLRSTRRRRSWRSRAAAPAAF